MEKKRRTRGCVRAYYRLSLLAPAAMVTARLVLLMIDMIQLQIKNAGAFCIPAYAFILVFCGWELKTWTSQGREKMSRRVFKHDFRGKRFGKLLAIEPTEERVHGKVMWRCRCDCGNYCTVMSTRLASGHTKSCGCYNSEHTIETNTTHGGRHTRLYSIWASMKTRCLNPNSKTYHYYGGRGISICDEWKDNFSAFRDWALSNGYRDDLTLDRIDSDKDYSPENCKWSTWHEQ